MPATADDAEQDLTLLGLVALEDPPRPGAAAALAACRRAGINVAMVTGDHPDTARAIAREVGLADSGRWSPVATCPPTTPCSGELLDRDAIGRGPGDPGGQAAHRRGPPARGHVVAMTGDGVNDAPALREAAIGVAMGQSGTDVAREAADLVLLDDDFGTIVAAVEQGRSTFANIRRFLTYHLTDNVAELAPFVVWALSGGAFPLAIGVLQVLALDIGTDVLPALALGAEPPGRHVLDRRPDPWTPARPQAVRQGVRHSRPSRGDGQPRRVRRLRSLRSGGGPANAFPTGPVMLAASGAAFTAVVFGQVANVFACRSTIRFAWQVRLRANRLLLGRSSPSSAMLVGFLYVPPLADLLGQSPPNGAGVLVAALAIPAVLAADTLHKLFARSGRTQATGG